MRGKQLNNVMTMVWIVNGLILLVAAGLYYGLNPAPAARASAPGKPTPRILAAPQLANTAMPSSTAVPPPTQRATITPAPSPSIVPSVTPLEQQPSVSIIGYSVGKLPQEVYRFGSGPVHKLIIAGIHGGSEWNTVALADQLIAYLNDHPDTVPADTTLYILRNLNPDGLARAHGIRGRANNNGVDLNRNWPYLWQADWPRDGCWIWLHVTGGKYGGSEPEVQNVITFIDKIKPAALISYHSAALGIFPGGRPDFAPSISLAAAVAQVSNYHYPPIDTGCDYTGDLTDWAANTRGIPSIDIELTNSVDTDFDQNLNILQVFLAWQK